MKYRHRLVQWLSAINLLSLSTLCCALPAYSTEHNETQLKKTSSQTELVVFLVRHAEKGSGNNPSLTAEGKQRAEQLAAMLADNQLNGIYSTDYKRTQETAGPSALKQQLEIQSYDPRHLEDFSDALKAKTGHYLVVGHSNTTAVLVSLLGGEPQGDIDDSSEYNRLYILNIKHTQQGNQVTSVLLRYGDNL
jgi:2,3-bisphosphoglycerate-dependent phosphoglycerate mutase